MLAGIPKWYNVIDLLLKIADDLIIKYDWFAKDFESKNIKDDSTIMTIGVSLSKIGFPPNKLDYYSEKIHKNIVEKTNNDAICLPFLEALSKQEDQRAHKTLQAYLKKHKNYYYQAFQALINYSDPEDLLIIEPYLSGAHVDLKLHGKGGDRELHKTAQSAYNKIKKAIEKTIYHELGIYAREE